MDLYNAVNDKSIAKDVSLPLMVDSKEAGAECFLQSMSIMYYNTLFRPIS
jgi:hypothetical protein